MTDWEDLPREIGERDLETGEYVVRRRQRRPIRDDSGKVIDWEYRWVKVGMPA